jgi:GNAT superfamily N-acetyltransferase
VTLAIDYLDNHLDAIPELARWHHEEWQAVTPHLSIDDRIEGFRERAHRGSIPTGFVAVLDRRVVGMACLVSCDVHSHAHLTPWLATVLVSPLHRGRGIGTALSKRATEEAQRLGVPTLYLFTFDKQGFYGRLGWLPFERAAYAGRDGLIMMQRLSA